MTKFEKKIDLTRPVSVWPCQENLNKSTVSGITMILRTMGCRWNRCTMCGYAYAGAPASANHLIAQFENAITKMPTDASVVKIYTSGSFLDPEEMPLKARDEILKRIEALGIKRLVIESRPEHIIPERIEKCLSHVETEFAIGLETSNDLIREHIICKGFTFQDFARASGDIRERGGRVKAYLLHKPPFLSEEEALKDAITSARHARPLADVLSLNLCNVQSKTTVERMWERGEYRPPWLWSALEVIKSIPGPIVCDPVGAGTKRGPHNCGKCDEEIANAIRTHAQTQDTSKFEKLDCECKNTWRELMTLERHSFSTPLM